jgi:hypothetical protein
MNGMCASNSDASSSSLVRILVDSLLELIKELVDAQEITLGTEIWQRQRVLWLQKLRS